MFSVTAKLVTSPTAKTFSKGVLQSPVIEVDMFTNDKPSTNLTELTSDNLSKKIEFEKERLSKWL